MEYAVNVTCFGGIMYTFLKEEVVVPLTSFLGSEFSDVLGIFKMYYFNLKNLEMNLNT